MEADGVDRATVSVHGHGGGAASPKSAKVIDKHLSVTHQSQETVMTCVNLARLSASRDREAVVHEVEGRDAAS